MMQNPHFSQPPPRLPSQVRFNPEQEARQNPGLNFVCQQAQPGGPPDDPGDSSDENSNNSRGNKNNPNRQGLNGDNRGPPRQGGNSPPPPDPPGGPPRGPPGGPPGPQGPLGGPPGPGDGPDDDKPHKPDQCRGRAPNMLNANRYAREPRYHPPGQQWNPPDNEGKEKIHRKQPDVKFDNTKQGC